MSGYVLTGVRLDRLPEIQANAVRETINGLRKEERRSGYRLRWVGGARENNFSPDTISFTDAEDRRWYIDAEGHVTWRT